MIQVKYTGKETLDHRSGIWKPGETKTLGRAIAFALVRERGDMEIVEGAPKAKPKKPQPEDGSEKKGVESNG